MWLDRIRNSGPFKAISDISAVAFAIGVIGAVIEFLRSHMSGRPFDIALLYSSVVGACLMVMVTYSVRLYRHIVGPDKQSSVGAETAPNPNVVFSHCRHDALSLGEEEMCGALMAEFFNDVLNPQDRANGVVAHLVYFSEPKPGREIGDPLWITRQGVWEPGHDADCDFPMNHRGGLVLAVIFSEDHQKPEAIYAVGYRHTDSFNPYGMETFEIEGNLPVVVKVTLRGPGFQRVFRFGLAKKNNKYTGEQLPTAS